VEQPYTGAHLVLIQPLVDQSGARPKIERREPTLELEEFGPDERPLHMYENNLKPIWPPIRERPSNLIRQRGPFGRSNCHCRLFFMLRSQRREEGLFVWTAVRSADTAYQ
jgi:hypothetical protein